VAQSAEAGETQSRQSEVKRVGRNSRDPGVSRDVFNSGIQVRRRNVIVVVVKAQIIGEPALPVHPSHAGAETLRAGSAIERGKYAYRVGRRPLPVQSKVDVVLISPAAAAASATRTNL